MRFIEEKAKELKNELSTITSSSSLAIVFDADPDGLCSAALFEKFLKEQGLQTAVVFRSSIISKDKPFSSSFSKIVKEKKITHIFIFDINLTGYDCDTDFISFKKQFPEIHVIGIDHHDYQKELPFNVLANTAYDQNQITPSQYCTSKYVYDLVSYLSPQMSSYKWFASIGLIGDWNHKTWGLFIRESLEELQQSRLKQKVDFKELLIPESSTDFFATLPGKISLFVYYGIAKSEREVSSIYSLLLNESVPENILSSLQKYKDVEEDVEDHIENYDYLEKYSDLKDASFSIFELEVKSPFDILVITANLITLKDKKTLFFLYKKKNDSVIFSLRTQNKLVDIGSVLKKVMSTFSSGKAGGHVFAGGGNIPLHDFTDFKTAFYNELEKVN